MSSHRFANGGFAACFASGHGQERRLYGTSTRCFGADSKSSSHSRLNFAALPAATRMSCRSTCTSSRRGGIAKRTEKVGTVLQRDVVQADTVAGKDSIEPMEQQALHPSANQNAE